MTINTRHIETMLAERGLTKAALADRCGISRQNVSAIIRRGTAEPRTVGKLAAGLGVSVNDIIKEPLLLDGLARAESKPYAVGT